MKISYQWLKRYIDTDLELDEILTVLTDIGLEVDGVERFESVRGGLEGVVVGEVLTCTELRTLPPGRRCSSPPSGLFSIRRMPRRVSR